MEIVVVAYKLLNPFESKLLIHYQAREVSDVHTDEGMDSLTQPGIQGTFLLHLLPREEAWPLEA